jgi:hypothetical protein
MISNASTVQAALKMPAAAAAAAAGQTPRKPPRQHHAQHPRSHHKPHHTHQRSSSHLQTPQVSHQRSTGPSATATATGTDYDSTYEEVPTEDLLPPAPPMRTNTELNLSVLRRYAPSVRTILSIAANAVVYRFSPTIQQWEKAGVEGTLFVCDTAEGPTAEGPEGRHASGQHPSACVIVLNRHGLNNLILEMGDVEEVEVMGEILSIRHVEGSEQQVLGIWVHADKDNIRSEIAGSVLGKWREVRNAVERDKATTTTTGGGGRGEGGVGLSGSNPSHGGGGGGGGGVALGNANCNGYMPSQQQQEGGQAQSVMSLVDLLRASARSGETHLNYGAQ